MKNKTPKTLMMREVEVLDMAKKFPNTNRIRIEVCVNGKSAWFSESFDDKNTGASVQCIAGSSKASGTHDIILRALQKAINFNFTRNPDLSVNTGIAVIIPTQ